MKTRTRASLRSTAGSASTVVGAKSVAESAAGAAAQAAAEPKPSLSRARTRSRAHTRAYSRDRSRGRSPSAAQPEAEPVAEPEAGRRSSRDRSRDRSRPISEREPADTTAADEAAAVSQPTEPSPQPRHGAQGVSPYRLRSPRFRDYPGLPWLYPGPPVGMTTTCRYNLESGVDF